ncbi:MULTISPECIES: hydroxymethylbilane synthase [Clostridium]|jgi:hydroxymethylbilane synthase (EC 2.5.1.61)|uniref:Porphobilinogen deaminase n=3 Tax=Clostridium TaxID=1485 RepID=HEM3_CLOB8|nr:MULTISPECIES: hydroxymethylbilane synthase [Clostridium]A6LSY5.1 RecName: Full=Porphobilinogen deaminase; Short=PBG; AltName: Full=Hydroxymethylbilane synthase; Short=HMBS; AltName: Full=Pre-uroporphyrinogen synthase [Clostridium beijerinckii NCIMB 8052]ABR33465.1 porphobilinogen deaminase [Clostridium beijerinckii NCIMB 8052]AIU00297.1 porphobilinogen deaminase [Clostridium beijerinckii ATCC 35702]ALB47383.1 hydroxymethylbilane synthase [Clostridium beijerinckii NRRL B-598]MBC2456809.1 hyd
MNKLTIATRKSKLAQTQTEIIMKSLKDKFNIDSEKMLIVTEGDRKLDVSLAKIGGKGLFVKDIEIALLEKRADGAVHSMKDVPYELSHEFEIAAITEREDIRDVLISKDNIPFKELRKGAIIGTSSIRRACQLKLMRNDLDIVPIRGNVQTRLEKMKEQNLDGIILASAGLKRLNEEDIITEYFDPKVFIPAVAQGALGIECLKTSSAKKYFEKMEDSNAKLTVEAERSFMRMLNGDCHSLIGAYSEIQGNDLYMIGIYDIGGRIVKKDILGDKNDHIELGRKLANKILEI